MTETPSTPPGWYPDPHAVNTQRYWDGKAWTDKMAPLGPLPKRPSKQLLPTWAIVVGSTFVVLFFLWFWAYQSTEDTDRKLCQQLEETYGESDC